MITIEELQARTGYETFRQFKRQCTRSANSLKFIGLTRYSYGKGKVVDLDILPEELFMAADAEIPKRRKIIKYRNS